MVDVFRWDGKTLELPELDAVAADLKKLCAPGTARFNYTMNAVIIRHFLGGDWFRKQVHFDAHQNSYLRPNFPADSDVDPKYSVQILELAEMLTNLQFVRGFHKVLEHLSLEQIESGIAELKVGQALTEKGIPFKYAEDTDRTTVDIIFNAPDGSQALCEIKCKKDSTPFSRNTVGSAFKEASGQIGKGNAGILFIRVPASWIEIEQSHASERAAITIPPELIEVTRDNIRQYSRIKKVILYVWSYAYDADWGLSSTHNTMEFNNPRNAPPWDVELLGAYEPGDWYSLIRMGERWAKEGMNATEDDKQLAPEDAARRRDEVIKRMLATPPQPRVQPVKKGRKKASRPS